MKYNILFLFNLYEIFSIITKFYIKKTKKIYIIKSKRSKKINVKTYYKIIIYNSIPLIYELIFYLIYHFPAYKNEVFYLNPKLKSNQFPFNVIYSEWNFFRSI